MSERKAEMRFLNSEAFRLKDWFYFRFLSLKPEEKPAFDYFSNLQKAICSKLEAYEFEEEKAEWARQLREFDSKYSDGTAKYNKNRYEIARKINELDTKIGQRVRDVEEKLLLGAKQRKEINEFLDAEAVSQDDYRRPGNLLKVFPLWTKDELDQLIADVEKYKELMACMVPDSTEKTDLDFRAFLGLIEKEVLHTCRFYEWVDRVDAKLRDLRLEFHPDSVASKMHWLQLKCKLLGMTSVEFSNEADAVSEAFYKRPIIDSGLHDLFIARTREASEAKKIRAEIIERKAIFLNALEKWAVSKTSILQESFTTYESLPEELSWPEEKRKRHLTAVLSETGF